ncbi:NUDIX hydrolase [Ramlibacter sp. PS4R-6]|uniref:NUDIX hydrolase n=1 Tax=Ramlibacter sp. PS4R-6 TaxID=3133438 RepID=UPI0030A8B8C6
MQINLEPSDSPVRAAATVVMLRDGPAGLEVFLVKRHGLSDVLGGAYVFPGGKLDDEDGDAVLHTMLDRTPAQLQHALSEPGLPAPDAAALFVAALRETFEESGVLFAEGADARVAGRAYEALREGLSFAEVLHGAQLRLRASELVPWSRWITPAVGGVIRKRFDTRFFLARVPAGQEPTHDQREATESLWLAPLAALQQYRDGAIQLAPPQIMSLAHLSRHAGTAQAFADATSRPPPLVHPEPFEQDGVRVICYPGDARHSIAARALPGPTRLHYVDGRFEPPGGFDALLRD